MDKNIPKWMQIFWACSLPGTLLFLGRMTYEYTYLTYKNGPQMIGFTLIHLYPLLYVFMSLSFLLFILWFLLCLIWIVKELFAKNKPQKLWMFFTTLVILIWFSALGPISTIFLK